MNYITINILIKQKTKVPTASKKMKTNVYRKLHLNSFQSICGYKHQRFLGLSQLDRSSDLDVTLIPKKIKIWGFPEMGGTLKWMVFTGQSHSNG